MAAVVVDVVCHAPSWGSGHGALSWSRCCSRGLPAPRFGAPVCPRVRVGLRDVVDDSGALSDLLACR